MLPICISNALLNMCSEPFVMVLNVSLHVFYKKSSREICSMSLNGSLSLDIQLDKVRTHKNSKNVRSTCEVTVPH